MRILWICNIMLPAIAVQLGRQASNKEGWLTGLCETVLERGAENHITLGIAFPGDRELAGWKGELALGGGSVSCYGFREDTVHAEKYSASLEKEMAAITQDFRPDVIHCFGTEYGHTLAVCRSYPDKSKILIGIQGLCSVYAKAYMADLPETVRGRITFRDLVKRDGLYRQQKKFTIRGEHEREALQLAGNVTGRTAWDRHYALEWNPGVRYFAMNETLRPEFYQGQWREEDCEQHTIFLSQGDYPVKGLHYMLLALPAVRERFPDVKVTVAGNSVVRDHSWKDRLKLSAYGSYLRNIINCHHLEKQVQFLGRLDAAQMKEAYLRSGLFVCCSAQENSPNSLGEAMLLGVPCVSADVGGIPSLFRQHEDGILYEGYRTAENSFDNVRDDKLPPEIKLMNTVKRLSAAILEMWCDDEKKLNYSLIARKHAKQIHDKEGNYRKLMEIYANVTGTPKD